MTADAYGLMATVGFALAAIIAVATTIFFFLGHVRDARDELTGRTQQRALAELRAGSVARSRFFGAGQASHGSGAFAGEGSGSLHVRSWVSSEAATSPASSELGPTLLSDGGKTESAATPGSEEGTTLLGAARDTAAPAPSEAGTTLLGSNGEREA